MKLKIISWILVLAGLMLWWEAPILCITCVAINGFIIYKHYDKSMCFKITIGLSLIVVLLCVWNWDLHIGTKILNWYYDK